ncbi:MAG: type II secretion system protein [Desulfobacteraceae bacterium]|nr:type II secretion system protein [Desulfobacteraceae bacterium]MBU4001690.1 type II secretion system GspH family protein [Pseudomonadota bacterium]MBU4052855.1 type II secretion system GspH family protein [Pseudomonadota bacterium]
MKKVNKKLKNQMGFTLVEIAIVMVIIGLLIGGVLKGQGLIQNAKVKNVVKMADGLRAAVMGFYDKYGVMPGDENEAGAPTGTNIEGNGNGRIDTATERFEVYRDLVLAGLLDGSYNGTSDLPTHPFGGNVDIYWVDPGPGAARHCIRYFNLPAEVCQEIDQKYDDGVYNTGSIAGSADYAEGTTVATFYIVF